jgi:hypothetical protein
MATLATRLASLRRELPVLSTLVEDYVRCCGLSSRCPVQFRREPCLVEQIGQDLFFLSLRFRSMVDNPHLVLRAQRSRECVLHFRAFAFDKLLQFVYRQLEGIHPFGDVIVLRQSHFRQCFAQALSFIVAWSLEPVENRLPALICLVNVGDDESVLSQSPRQM